MKRIHRLLSLLLVILLAIVGNLFVAALEEHSGGKIDLTASNLTRFSDETLSVVDSIDDTIHIYLLFRSSTQNELRTILDELTAKYHARNSHIVVDTLDPVLHPGRIMQLVEDTSELTEGSLIVTNKDESRRKTILAGELYYYSYSNIEQQYTQSSFVGESKITTALMYVSEESPSKIYMLTGHNEINPSYSSIVYHKLENDNYEVASLDISSGNVPSAGDTIVIIAPSLDLTDFEYDVLLSYLDNGGRLFFCSDVTIDLSKLPNFSKLLAYYGLSMPYGMVIENAAATENYIQSVMYIVPSFDNDSDITAPLTSGKVVLPFAGAVQRSSIEQPGFETHVLLKSSNNSYMKEMDSIDNFVLQETDDQSGPFPLAISMVRANEDGSSTRLIVMNNVYAFIDNNYLYSTYNLDYTMNCFGFLTDKETPVYIRSKPLASTSMRFPNEQVRRNLILTICIVIPCAVLLTGFVIYLKRRKTNAP